MYWCTGWDLNWFNGDVWLRWIIDTPTYHTVKYIEWRLEVYVYTQTVHLQNHLHYEETQKYKFCIVWKKNKARWNSKDYFKCTKTLYKIRASMNKTLDKNGNFSFFCRIQFLRAHVALRRLIDEKLESIQSPSLSFYIFQMISDKFPRCTRHRSFSSSGDSSEESTILWCSCHTS